MKNECEKIFKEDYKNWCLEGLFMKNEEGPIVHSLNSLRARALNQKFLIGLSHNQDVTQYDMRLKQTLSDMRTILGMIDETVCIKWLGKNQESGIEEWEQFKQEHQSGNE